MEQVRQELVSVEQHAVLLEGDPDMERQGFGLLVADGLVAVLIAFDHDGDNDLHNTLPQVVLSPPPMSRWCALAGKEVGVMETCASRHIYLTLILERMAEFSLTNSMSLSTFTSCALATLPSSSSTIAALHARGEHSYHIVVW